MSNDSPPPSSCSSAVPTPLPISNYHSYPEPQAEYQEIIQNPDVFLHKLQAFHVFYGTRIRVPTLGGNQLDLHRLFLEVTSRGGIEKVIKDRRWKEVTGAFNFPSTITNASFVLRRYYLSLLYHFEQVYYFRKKEPSIPAQDQSRSANGSKLPLPVDEEAASKQLAVCPELGDGSIVTGTIDGKFDHGYLVTVNFGSEDLKGVLYHAHAPAEPNASHSFNISGDSSHRTLRKHQTSRDPSHPKRNRSGYTFFFAEQYHRLRPSYHGQERGISKKIGQLWSGLSEAEKLVYQEKGLRDRERYKAEMLEYKSSQHG